MAKRICSIDGCGRPHKGHGWCEMHWQRWKKHGDPLVVKPGGTPENSPGALTKRCTKCGEVKPLEEFTVSRRNKDGRGADCKPCRRAKNRTYTSADWRETNRERYLTWQREYNQLNKEHQRPAKLRYEQLSRLGHDREALAYADILRRDPCAYCGNEAGTVDHIEPTGIGSRGDPMNLTAACASCNRRKRQLPLLVWLLKKKGSIHVLD